MRLSDSEQLKKRDAEAATQKAILEQKLELLQRQIDDYKLRELNFKLFNENIFSLLNELSSDKKLLVRVFCRVCLIFSRFLDEQGFDSEAGGPRD